MVVAARRPDWLGIASTPDKSRRAEPLPIRHTFVTVIGWLLVWAAPLLLVLVTLGPDNVLWKIGIFFSRLAVVTFGGAYAVLAYVAQESVQTYGWLQPGEMADGLGLAESTPGPLIMVTQFVGFWPPTATRALFSPLWRDFGGMLTTWVTFAPCFLWIFALAP